MDWAADVTDGPCRSPGPAQSQSGCRNRAAQDLTVARLLWAVALMSLRPNLARFLSLPSDKRTMTVVRFLGLRHLLQAGCTRSATSRQVGIILDLLHSISMLLLAVLDIRRRRMAFVDAAVACGFVLGGLAAGATNQEGNRETDVAGLLLLGQPCPTRAGSIVMKRIRQSHGCLRLSDTVEAWSP